MRENKTNWHVASAMKKVGIVASDSSEEKAVALLQEGFESEAKAEDLVLMKNRIGEEVLGVLRGGMGIDESLKVGTYRPSVAYAKKGGSPSGARETFCFSVQVLGSVLPDPSGGIGKNRTIIAPRSDIMLLDEKDKPSPMEMIVGKKEVQWIPRAHYQERSSWLIPAETRYLNYHVGIFGSTGCGKSYLARFSLIPMFLEAKYRVLVLDWSGVDYAPHYGDKVTRIRDVALDEAAVVEYLATKMQHFSYRGANKTENQIYTELEEFVGDDWQARIAEFDNALSLRTALHDGVLAGLQTSAGNKPALLAGWTRNFERGFRKLTEDHLKVVMGKKTVEDLVSGLKDIAVIDMHEVGTDEKLSFFSTLANHLTDLMDAGQELNMALVIDEGPQYVPWEPRGLQVEATEMIKGLCALGRKHKLSVVMLSQGISGDIGINAAVRRNLNTQFFGRIHPLDMIEAGNWLSPYGISPEDLLSMQPGYFYYSGRMNPSPIPLLMTFTIED
jgi:hypothetical protein